MAMSANSLEHAIMLEDRGQVLCASAGYFAEGIAAFLGKHTPLRRGLKVTTLPSLLGRPKQEG